MNDISVGDRGDFNDQVVFGFFKPTIGASLPDASWFGMRIDLYSLNAILTDEEGALWYVLRFHDHGYSPMFRLRTNGHGRNLYTDIAETRDAYVGPVRHSSTSNSHIARSAVSSPGRQAIASSAASTEWNGTKVN